MFPGSPHAVLSQPYATNAGKEPGIPESFATSKYKPCTFEVAIMQEVKPQPLHYKPQAAVTLGVRPYLQPTFSGILLGLFSDICTLDTWV